jgi:hypothetical protein
MSSPSRRRFLEGSAAALFIEGCARQSRAPVGVSTATSAAHAAGSTGPAEGDLVVEPTPSLYFVEREPGSREMKWGPAKEYGDTVDESGNVQPRPEDVVWNQQGLGYDGHAPLEIMVGVPTMMP